MRQGSVAPLRRAAGVLGAVARPVAARTSMAAGLGLVAAWLGATREQPLGASAGVDPTAAWIRLPMFLVAVVAVITTIESWPGFGQDRGAAASWVRRARLWPARGTATAAGTGCLVAAAVLAGTGFLFGTAAGAAAARPIRAVEVLADAGLRVLGGGHASADYDVPTRVAGVAATTLEIRARPAFVPGAAVTMPDLAVRCGGVDLGVMEFPEGGGLGRLALPSGFEAPIRLGVASGQRGFVALGPGAVRLTREVDRSPPTNAVLAALAACWPVGTALGLSVLLHALVGRATLLVVAVGVLLLGFSSGLPGAAKALDAYARAEEVDLSPFTATRAPDRSPG